MTQQHGTQPEVRFSRVGPNSIQGISYLPKIFFFEKDIIAAGDDDFWSIPAGTYVENVVVRAEVALDGSGTVTMGKDGDPDGFVDTTVFDPTVLNETFNSMGSTVAQGGGEFFPAADTFRIAVGGTPTLGKISGFVRYFEMAEMATRGAHFSL